MSEETLRHDLDAARATISEQAARILALEQRPVMPELGDVLDLASITELVSGAASYRALLDSIVQAAGRLFRAGAASIALLDPATDELVFEASMGNGSDQIIGMRFPAHQGIAGWVMMTGEPIAVSDVHRDPRFAREVAQSTGYVPHSILAVPLLIGEEVEGVLEVLDKVDAASFGLDDMEMLTLFARPAAIAVEQARASAGKGLMLLRQIREEAGTRDLRGAADAADLALERSASLSDETLEIARLVHTLSQRGGRATRLALEVLQAIVRST